MSLSWVRRFVLTQYAACVRGEVCVLPVVQNADVTVLSGACLEVFSSVCLRDFYRERNKKLVTGF